MVSNQTEFNNEYSKSEEEIRIRDEVNFKGPLIIEGYLELKKLYLRKVRNIKKVNLKNLPQLKKCAIWGCDMEELVIENCPNLEKLRVEHNLLSNLDFVKGLEKLKSLKLDHNFKIDSGLQHLPESLSNFSYKNTKLTEFLKPDWEIYNKERQELIKMAKQNPQKLAKDFWDLSKRYERVKKRACTLSSRVFISRESYTVNTTVLLSDLEDTISNLEFQVWELTELSEQEKESIQTYLDSLGDNFDPKKKKLLKNLTWQLVKAYLNFFKFKKQCLESSDYHKLLKCYEKEYKSIEDKLENELGEEAMNKIQRILTKCETVVEWEQKVEAKIGTSESMISQKKKEMPNSIWQESEERVNALEKKVDDIKEQKINQEKAVIYFIDARFSRLSFDDNSSFNSQNNQITNVYQIQYNQYLANEEFTKLDQKYQDFLEATNETSSDCQKLKKTILFLGAKQIFANTRQDTINSLDKIYKGADESSQNYDNVAAVGEEVSSAGWIADFLPAPGAGAAFNLLGKGITAISNFFKNNSLTKYSHEFENYLIEDEKAISLLEKTYLTLDNSLQGNEKGDINPFIRKILNLDAGKFDQYNVFTVSELQKEEELTPEKMKSALGLLTNDLKKFVNESKQKVQQCVEEMEKFFKEKNGEHLQTEVIVLLEKLNDREEKAESNTTGWLEDLQRKIATKKANLESLIAIVKDKLKSRNLFPSAKQERIKKLDQFFKNLSTNPEEFIKELENIKCGLSWRVTEQEVRELCQTKIELNQLQKQLESLQGQRPLIEVPCKSNNE